MRARARACVSEWVRERERAYYNPSKCCLVRQLVMFWDGAIRSGCPAHLCASQSSPQASVCNHTDPNLLHAAGRQENSCDSLTHSTDSRRKHLWRHWTPSRDPYRSVHLKTTSSEQQVNTEENSSITFTLLTYCTFMLHRRFNIKKTSFTSGKCELGDYNVTLYE